jgi:hypothetical protein
MNPGLNLPGPLDFADESLILDVELHSLLWVQWSVEGEPEAMARQIAHHHRAVNWLACLTGKRVNRSLSNAPEISPRELAIDVCVGR